jgi:hypothetical protein
MRRTTQFLTAGLLCLALPGCYVNTYGLQSNKNGATTTTTASQVSGSAGFSGGKVSFTSGQVPPPGAPGGYLRLSGYSGGAVVAVLVLGDLLNYIAGRTQPKPLPADAKIMETCSCYKKEVTSDK